MQTKLPCRASPAEHQPICASGVRTRGATATPRNQFYIGSAGAIAVSACFGRLGHLQRSLQWYARVTHNTTRRADGMVRSSRVSLLQKLLWFSTHS